MLVTARSSRTSLFSSLAALAAGLAMVVSMSACDGDKSSESAKTPDGADASPATAEAAEGGAPAKIAGKPVEGEQGAAAVKAGAPEEDTYTIVIEPPESVPQGSDAMVTVKVVPQGKWHMNLEYPTSLSVQAPEGVTLAKAKLEKGDALKLDDENCEFGIGFTPDSAGEKKFKGTFKFAVCQDEACAPKTEEIEFAVAVN